MAKASVEHFEDMKPSADQVERVESPISSPRGVDAIERAPGHGEITLDMLEEDKNFDPIDVKAEQRLLRKIDLWIIPFICITYLLNYIDKATLSYATLFGLSEDAHLVGTDYSWLGSIFYFGYLVAEYPTSFAMQKWSVTKWLSLNVFLWGGICMALGGCNNFEQLAALRFLLGMLESCASPAYLLMMGMWYTIEEQPIRIAWWGAFLGVANSFGGLLAYGIGNIHGSLPSWRFQFIIVGAISTVWGIIMFIFLAESPMVARWLTPEQKHLAINRLRRNQTGAKDPAFKMSHIIEALCDPKTWFIFLFGCSTQVVNGSVSNFGTLLIQGFGFGQLDVTLLQIPYGAIIAIAVVSSMYIQRALPGQQRCLVAGIYVLFALAGVIGLNVLPTTSSNARLGCYYLQGMYSASVAMCWSLIIANTGGTTKRTFVSAAFFVSYCVGNIIGPFAFKTDEAPVYQSGIIAIMTAYCVELAVLISFATYLAFIDRKKKQALVASGREFASVEEKNAAADADLTDFENPFFRYTW